MITMVIATRNRAYTLRLVAPSFFQQEKVSEIIFVDDCGTDNTRELIADIAMAYPNIKAIVHSNKERNGQSKSRNVGAALATNEYVLFCDDDEYMEPGYAKTCLEKLQKYNAGAVSGRRVYMIDGEDRAQALVRFGNGLRPSPLVYYTICEYVNGAIFEGDRKVPITNAIILTRKDLLVKYPFDDHYAIGNGYREESDFQLGLMKAGYDLYITNDAHTVHLPMSQVRTGGQRVKRFDRIYWSVANTKYLYDKYYEVYSNKLGLWAPKPVAIGMYAVFALYKELIKPLIYPVAMAVKNKIKKPA